MLGEDQSFLVIMGNFKGQITPAVLKEHKIFPCLLPPNTTDRLQPMDLSVNKAFKVHLRKIFEEWYANQVSKQGLDLQAVLLSLPHLREKGAKWLTNAASYISNNPQIIVNGFVGSGITHKLDSLPTGTSGDVQ